jgi:hypothetical protein
MRMQRLLSGACRLHLVLVVLLGLSLAGAAQAGVRRYHFMPNLPPGISMKPVAMYGAVPPPPRPTTQVTYRHPYTGQMITIPLQLPEDTPKIEHRYNRLIYNYGSDTVTILFLPDGTADVIYNTGFLRAP